MRGMGGGTPRVGNLIGYIIAISWYAVYAFSVCGDAWVDRCQGSCAMLDRKVVHTDLS